MQVDAIPTRLSPAEADLTLVVNLDDPSLADAELRGRLMGPRSAYAETVEVAYALRPLPREGERVRAQVLIPEPCFWSPEKPLLYQGPVERWQSAERKEQTTLVLGLKEVTLRTKGLRLNGQPYTFKGVQCRRLDEATASEYRAAGVNLLVVPVTAEAFPVWTAADRFGFFVIGVIDPEDDALLWRAAEELPPHPSCFGWLLPHELIARPQHWHNAMLLLHGKRNVFVGVRVEALPVGVLPGHVTFLAADAGLLPDLDGVNVPKLAYAPRGGEATPAPPLQTPLLGWVHRTLPGS
jgi:hypothetical protein